MNIPQITKEETLRFSKVWNLNGVSVLTDSTTLQFATDFANTVLRSVVPLIQKQLLAAVQKPPEKKLVVEG